MEYQRDLKEQVLEHQRAQRAYVAETGELLNRLMENSRRVGTLSLSFFPLTGLLQIARFQRLANNSANGSTQLRVVSPAMHSPSPPSISSHTSV